HEEATPPSRRTSRVPTECGRTSGSPSDMRWALANPALPLQCPAALPTGQLFCPAAPPRQGTDGRRLLIDRPAGGKASALSLVTHLDEQDCPRVCYRFPIANPHHRLTQSG